MSFRENTDRLRYSLLVAVFFVWESIFEREINSEFTFLLSEVESEWKVHVANVNLECLRNKLVKRASLDFFHLQNVMAQKLCFWVMMLAYFG